MQKPTSPAENLLYDERLSSAWTTALFVFLAAVFLGLFIWRTADTSLNLLAGVFLFLFLFFLFYVFNFHTLVIRITSESLRLKFGLFSWKVPLENIESCALDEIPAGMRYGGAGVHLMFIRRRYRASFNFLEFPRVVIAFKQKVGPVRDISFSTRKPEEILKLLDETTSKKQETNTQ
jgi:hypothetical protein